MYSTSTMTSVVWWRLLVVIFYTGHLPTLDAGHYTLSMDSETSCTRTHYYEDGDVFQVLVKGQVHDGHCPLKFIQSGSYRSDSIDDPCVSVCVKIIGYTMESCEVKMSYHDGLNDFTPVTFDCHTFPPVLWCSSKNDLKVAVSEQKNYRGKDYSVHLEVKPYCGTYTPTTDSGIISQPKPKSNSMSQVVLIIGSIVGTISIIFVLGWIMYCLKRRQADAEQSSSERRPERNARDTTPSQGTRYAPVDRNQPSSQSSSDRGTGAPFKMDPDRGKPPGFSNIGERHLYSPFQPPQQRNRPPQGPQQNTFYSDLDRGPGGPGDKWYPMTTVGQAAAPNLYSPTPSSQQQQNQYLSQNQVYKYPQYDGEMHTAPTDTRYVVYDFDFDQPMERKFSAGKARRTPVNDTPVKDIDSLKKREITPLRETIRVMPPIDSTTTDHTSENESSVSGTTEDETTTDDQMPPAARPYNMMLPYGYFGPGRQAQNEPSSKMYDPKNFNRMDNRNIGYSDSVHPPGPSDLKSRQMDNSVFKESPRTGNDYDTRRPSQSELLSPDRPSQKEGPMPQVPPIPKEFQRSQMTSPTRDLPWPHGPPPPYSPDDSYVV